MLIVLVTEAQVALRDSPRFISPPAGAVCGLSHVTTAGCLRLQRRPGSWSDLILKRWIRESYFKFSFAPAAGPCAAVFTLLRLLCEQQKKSLVVITLWSLKIQQMILI